MIYRFIGLLLFGFIGSVITYVFGYAMEYLVRFLIWLARRIRSKKENRKKFKVTDK